MEIENEELERIRCESMYAGEAAALEQLESDLRQKAGVEFSVGHDEQAKWLRQLAIDIGKRALDKRKRQKDFSPKFPGFGV